MSSLYECRKNFNCNGVQKSKGQFLDEKDAEKMGEKFLADHLNKDFIQHGPDFKEPKKEKEAPKK